MNAPEREFGTAIAPAQPVQARRRLFRKYAAFFVAVVCVALLINGIIEIRFSIPDYTEFSIRVQREQAESAAAKINGFIKGIEGQIGWTTQLPWNAATLDEWHFDMARLLRQVPAITELSRIDAAGRERLRVSRLAANAIESKVDFSRDPRFVEARANRVYYGPVYFRRDSEPYMTLGLAGARADDGVSVAEVNLKFIWDVVSVTKVGRRGHAYVVDEHDRLVAHPDLSLVLRNTDFSRLSQVQAVRASGSTGARTTEPVESFEGHRVLAASAPVADLRWLVFAELPVQEAYAPLEAAIRRSLVVLVAALVLASLAGLFLARKMMVPIQALGAGAARIGGGDLGQRISVKTGDELETLADQFNHMAARLQEAYANLEQKVAVRTSELTSANRRLATQWERLQRANAFKSEMLGTVAHDLKNPMSVIMGRAEMLMELMDAKTIQRDQVTAQIKHIREAVQRLTQMIDTLLADAMADALDISIRRGRVDLPMLVKEVADSSRPLIAKKEQNIAVAALGPVVVIGDHERLREAINNLVSNAVKYSPRGGNIDLAVSREGSDAVIRISDNGPGLSADDMSRLFGRFQRLSATPTAGESSTGLGLSIVKRIVELHGGQVTADSAGPGRGSVFTISLPLHPDLAG